MLARGQEAKMRDIEGRSNQLRQVLVGLDEESDFILSQYKGIRGFKERNGGEGYECDTI